MMDTPTPADRALRTLVSTYADRAPVNVDPAAMARSARLASADRPRPIIGFGRLDLRPAVSLVVLALLAAIATGALVTGGWPWSRDGVELLTGTVKPFVGLAPIGSRASEPRDGRQILSFHGRLDHGDYAYVRLWLYDDGRLITLREESVPVGIVERRLTPAGIEQLLVMARDAGMSARLSHPDVPGVNRQPGVIWGSITFDDGTGPLRAGWSESWLPDRMVDVAAWLPDDAWADARGIGYVPSVYAVCIPQVPRSFEALPPAARAVLDTSATVLDPPTILEFDNGCRYQVGVADAHRMADALSAVWLLQDRNHGLGIRMGDSENTIWFLPMLPDGEVVCVCG